MESVIYIVEIMCASGFKISDICYTSEWEADKFVNNQIVGQDSLYNLRSKTRIAGDGTVYRIRPLMLR